MVKADLRRPDTRAAFEVGAPAIVQRLSELGGGDALRDLISLLTGTLHSELADPSGRGTRVGVIARPALSDAEQVRVLPSPVATR